MRLKNNLIFLFGLVIPAIFVFKALFLPGPLAWGDAPYFYPEGLGELVSEPFSWISRGENFGGVNHFLWLGPLMFLYGLLHTAFDLGNDAIIRILFYFPAVALSFIGPILFTKYLKFPPTVQFFASLVYALNTYFLLLVDGGQVGIALAYGLFPLTLLFLRKLIDEPEFKRFFVTLVFLFLLTVADPRIAAIALLTIVIWGLLERKAGLKYLILLVMAVTGLVAYWFVPLVKLGGSSLSLAVSRLQLLSLLNPLLLFQPHWPLNEFGKVFPPPFYFVGIPFLIFGSLLLRKKKDNLVFVLLFLIFAFLVKGEAPPLGGLYQWAVSNIPLFSAFRDSSKFFVPLFLVGGILIGATVDSLKRGWVKIGAFLYLLFIIHPALLGNLNFVLSDRVPSGSLRVVYKNLKDERGFFRAAWFPERHPQAFHTEEKPALDAKELVRERPFAAMNVGSFDLFNFMHNERFLEWFEVLGIKYLVFSGDPRKITLNEEEQILWDDLLTLTATTSGLIRTNWQTSFPVYEVPETKPRIFAVDKLVAVVGGDDLYRDLEGEISDQAFVFFEDGRLNPRNLERIASESAVLVFNNKEEIDLTMSFLQDYFIGPGEAKVADWAVYGPEEYLTWKYQLLIRDLETTEFDYGKGIVFSSERNEKLEFNLNAACKERPCRHDFILAIRGMSDSDESMLSYQFGDEGGEFKYGRSKSFSWFIKSVNLKKGKHKLILENSGGLQVINTVALIPKSDWDEAQQLTKNFIGHFGTVEPDDLGDFVNKSIWGEVEFEKASPVRYRISAPKSANWVVFTDSYHPLWKLKQGSLIRDGLPFYSAVNGFYVEPDWTKTEIIFEGQKEVRWGLYFSAISFLTLAIIFLWFYPAKRRAGLKKR